MKRFNEFCEIFSTFPVDIHGIDVPGKLCLRLPINYTHQHDAPSVFLTCGDC